MDFNFDTSTISSVLELDPGASNLSILGTAGALLPAGTTAQRVGTPGIPGNIRFNTTLGSFETYDGVTWSNVQVGSSALTSLSNLSGTGFIVHTGPGTFAERWVVPVSGQTTITNGDGTSGNVSIGLANVGTAGTYVSVTADEFGRIVAGNTTQSWSTITGTPTTLGGYGISDAYTTAQTANLTWNWSSITNTPTTISGYGITDAASSNDLSTHASNVSLHLTSSQNTFIDDITVTSTQVNYLTGVTGNVQPQIDDKLSKSLGGTMNGNIVMSAGTHITINSAPVNGTDAANKTYVDSIAAGLSWQQPVTSTGTALPGTATLGDRFLNTTDDKIYTATATNTWNAGVAPTDGWSVFDQTNETGYVFNGTDWVQFTGTGQITAGVGLSKTVGNQLDVNLGAGIAQLPSDEVGVDVYSAGGLWLTENGLGTSANTNAQLGIRTDGGTLTVSSSGIKVSANSISEIHLTSSVAGTGLTGGNGTALTLATTGTPGTFNNVTTDAYGRVTSGSTVSYLTSNQTITVTGDVSGSGSTSIPTTLANVGTAGTYVSVSTDSKGRVTAGSTTQAWSTITGTPTTLSGYGITDAVKNNGTAPSIQSGTFANIAAAGTVGALYITSDTNIIYRDNGTSWVEISSAGGLVLYTENPVTPTVSTASGDNAVTIGSGNAASGTVSFATGADASTAIYGAEVRANGSFTNAGDAQTGKYILRKITTNSTQAETFLDGTSARITLPNNSSMTYTAYIVGRRTDATGSTGSWKIEGAISRDATAASTTLVGNRSKTILTRPNANWDAEVYADTTAGALTFKVTGQTSQTIRWVVTVITSEVTNGAV